MSGLTLLTVPPFSTLCGAAFALRRDVFVHEQKVPPEEELDAHDVTATHLVAILDGEVVGTLRIVFLAEHAKIGRVAVNRHYRGRGIAKAMMAKAAEVARNAGQPKLHLGAQLDKLSFYERLGFVAFGEVFDDGGMPHRAMRNYDLGGIA
jgi:predicted GNAT family N-acyltransferase